MDQENSSYTTIVMKSLFDKDYLSELQSKTNLVENRLNNNSKVLKEARNRISETYDLCEKLEKKLTDTKKKHQALLDKHKKLNNKHTELSDKLRKLSDKYEDIYKIVKDNTES